MVRLWLSLFRVPYAVLFPAILFFCCIGTYSVNHNLDNVFATGPLPNRAVPKVPIRVPSAVTSILAPCSWGVLPRAWTRVQSATRSPCAKKRSSCSQIVVMSLS